MKKRKDGRYQSSVTITDPLTNEKKRIYVYGYSEDEIIREKERVRRNNGAKSVIENIPFKNWLNEWLEIKRKEITSGTLIDYKFRLNKHVVPLIGEIPLAKITPATIRSVINKTTGDRNKKYIHMLLKSIFQQAYIDGILKRNPCIAVKSPKYKKTEKSIISEREFNLLLSIAKSKQYKNMFILAYYTGMRRAEICALKWKDVDLDNKVIHITSSAKKVEDGYIVGEPKTENSIRNILLSKSELNALRQQYLYQQENFLQHGAKVTKYDFVFTSGIYFNQMITPPAVSRIFERVKNKSGIRKHITFHSFRHTHATMLLEYGVSIKAIQARLGHATPNITLINYTHNTDKMQSDIISILNKEPKII